MKKAAERIINDCISMQPGEKVLIITDKNKLKIGEAIQKAAENATLIEIPVGKVHGEEPPKEVAEEMKKYDIILAPTSKSLTHTKAFREVKKLRARGATLPGITEDMMHRAIDVDYEAMARNTHKLKDLLDKAKEIRVITKSGTDIKFSVDGREAKADTGMLREKGKFGNLPAGEAFVSPVEGTAEGRYVIDSSVLDKKVENPITLVVEGGYVVKITGKEEAEELQEKLENVHDRNAFNIAELGIGTNEKATITGKVLEDEKVKGTAHIALGNNMGFGGNIDVPIHIDGVFLAPTIYADGIRIIEDGNFLF